MFHLFPFAEDTKIIGRSSKDISPIVDQNGGAGFVVAPIWLFNQIQTEGKLAEYMKGKKEKQLIQKCTSIFHPSVIYAEMKRSEPEIEDVVFRQGGVDFTGSAHILLPQNLDRNNVFHCSNLNLTKDLNLQPICYQRGDMNSVMTFRPVQAMSKTIFPYRSLHILDVEGYQFDSIEGVDTITDNTYDKTVLLWAWHLIALSKQEPVELQLSTILKKIQVESSVSNVKLTNAIYRIIHQMCFHLYFGLGPLFESMSFNKDNLELNKAARDLEELVEQNLSNSGLKAVTVMFSDDKIYMCEAHESCWQVNGELTEVPTNLFKSNSYFLKSIHLANNKIESLPEDFFTRLPCLADIDIHRNHLKEIPSNIEKSKRLLALNISYNLLTTLPEEMAACKLLERLDITGNKMKVIPPVVTKLTNLYRFYASNMLLKELPDDFGNLVHLDKLNLNGNCFTSLPKSFTQLKNLTELFLNGVPWFKAKGNGIVSKEHFEEHLAQNGLLEWLEDHDQDKLSIFKFFDEDTNGTLDQKELGKLNAVMFNIFPRFGYKGMEPPDDDMPSGFPAELLELTKLSYLGFRYHGIISVPEEIDRLTELTVLHVGNNPNLLSLPAQLANLQLKRLDIEDCPMLKTPPKEIRAKGFATTIAYLKRLLSGSSECMRTKLMLVGLGGAGKTSLVKALLSNDNKTKLTVGEDITDGIDICPWKVKTEEGELTFSVWDFAGQTVYYNTHQFFLSDRAVYLLLWNIRLGHEHAGLDFWLSSISVHAPKAPIFIVGTHVDQVSKVELPTKSMLERYPQIAGFHYISSHTGKGIDELKTNLVEETLTQQYMGEKIPGVWLGLEQSLQEIQEKCVITYSELEKRANISGIFDKSEVSQAVQFLHELGSLQYFQNEFLKGHVVISPQWIVDVMACIVSVKDSDIKDGRLRHADIGKVWKKYPEDLHWWLLRLTEEFDLTFRLTDKPLNIIPCLLPEKEPEIDWPDIEKNSSLKETKMVYKFDYLPAGLFNRGQVRLHQFSDSAYIWKRGSFLKKNEHICLIKQVKESELVVKAQGARPENVLFLVHEVFEGLIAESFQGVTYDFFLPCPDCQKLVLKDPHLFAASTIRRATELRAPFLQCLKYFHTISIIDLQAMLPPDSNTDYDLHLVQAVRGLKELKKELATDLFMSYCAEDIRNASDSVPCKTIVNDLQNKGYKCWYKEDASKYTVDEMARALIDSSVFVAFISNNYVKDETCCNLFKYARLTLHKPIIIIAIGSGLDWKQSKLGILLVDEVFVDMRNKDRYKHKFPELIKTIHHRLKRTIEIPSLPPCFISYCWQNSLEAVSKGSRQVEGAIGVTDPRSIKAFLEQKKIKCWLDVERTGNNGLFDDIAEGLINANLMVACVSDEYSSSPNCQYEFRYAVNTLKLPIVLAVVGTGSKWRASEIGILSLDCPIVSFQEKSETAYDKLLEIVKSYMPEDKAEQKKVENNAGTQQKDLSFQELLELAQRKFLRQIMHYAEKQDTSPYPRLFVTDFMKQKTQEAEEEKKDENKKEESTDNQKIKKRKSELVDDDFYRQKYSVNILCENDEGWHCCSDPLPLPQDFGTTNLEKFSPYIARVTAIAKYNKHLLLNCLESEEGQNFLKWLEESPQVAVNADFEQIYYELRQEVIQADISKTMGSLSRCHLPNGKIIWLCEEHQKSMRVTVLSNEDVTNISKATESLTIDYMLQALREVDISDVSSRFKGHKQRIGSAKRQIENVKEQKPPAATNVTSQSVEKKPAAEVQNADKKEETKPKPDSTKPNSNRPSSRESLKMSPANPVPQSRQNESNNSNQSNVRPLTRQTSRACNVM